MADLPRAADHATAEPLDVQRATIGPPCFNATGLRLRLNPVAPSPKQAAFLATTNREALFGGAGGGGKSIALLMGALMFVDVPGYNAIILRRTLQSLKLPNGLIDWSHRWLGDVPAAHWNGNDYQWTFDTGTGNDPATLTFGYLSHLGSEDKYRSSELHYIAFDELTEFPWEDQYTFMFSRLRRAKDLHGAAPDGLTLNDVPLRVRAACVDEGEVLTVADGWKDIRDVKAGELVYSVTEDGTLQPKKVTAHHAYDNDKPFVRVQMRNLSMSMTDDHRVTHLSFNSRYPARRRYETLPYNEHSATCIDVARAPRSIEAPGYTGDPLSWGTEVYLAYLGLFLAEGSAPPARKGNYKVLVTQCNPVGAERVADLMERVPLRSCRMAGGDFQITNKAAWEHFRPFGKAHEKYVPREVLSTATADQLRLLLDWLVFGDGHVRGESIQYVTCSPRLADDVAEIGFKLGYKAKITRKELPNPNHNDRYTVYLTPGITTRVEKSGPRSPVSHEEFGGKVYCIEVADNHNFVLRQRGTVWISGNTNPGGPGMPWVKRRFVAPETAKRPFLASLLSDNPGIDADEYRQSLQELSEVERKRMEEGDWDAVEVPGALWRYVDFAWTDRMEPRPVAEVDARAIGVDPSVSEETGKGDEVGIVMGSITGGTVTAELDLSGKMHPDDWARVIVTAYHDYGCSSVIVEDNQGKALLHTALRGASDQLDLPMPRLFAATAKESKEARALPVSQAYRANPKRVIHDLALKGGTLEAQLTSWVPRRPTATMPSPDRLDALVWLVRHLLYGDGKAVSYRAVPANPQAARSSVATVLGGRMPGV